MSRTIALLTGGGDCPGLNAAIRTVVRVATRQYGWRVIGIEDGFEGLIERRYRELTVNDTRGILRLGGTILGSSNRTNPFEYRGTGQSLARDASADAHETLSSLGVNGLVVVGGDGTLSLTHRFAAGRVQAAGIPKTIDNDVHATDFSIGFDTCVATVTDAVNRLHTTAESHHRVAVIEVMGRTAGWLALFAGVAGGADVILIPERSFSIAEIKHKIDQRAAAGRRFTIVVAAEGVAAPSGDTQYVSQIGAEHTWRLGGIGNVLAAALADACDQEVRATVLGHLQRGGAPSPTDRLLATQLAFAATEALHDQHQGVMAGVRGGHLELVPLEHVAIGPRAVPVDHPVLRAAEAMGMYAGR